MSELRLNQAVSLLLVQIRTAVSLVASRRGLTYLLCFSLPWTLSAVYLAVNNSAGGTGINTRSEVEPTGGSSNAAFMNGIYATRVYHNSVDGLSHIDVPATISQLQALHANTYAYLIYPGANPDPQLSRIQLSDLPVFAEAATEAKITVYVYLVPPTGTTDRDYSPFGWDYLAWVSSIGQIASSRPSIRGIMIDDFGANATAKSSKGFYFTPDYVSIMAQRARSHAPWLEMIAVLYFHEIVGPEEVLSAYRQVFDGVVFPYFAGTKVPPIRGNTRDATKARVQGVRVANVLNCRSDTCLQGIFPARSIGDPTTDMAVLGGTYEPVPGQQQKLSLWLNGEVDNVRTGYNVEVLVDGRVVGRYPSGRGWTHRSFELTEFVRHAPKSSIQVRLIRLSTSSRDKLALLIDDLSTTGFVSGNDLSLAHVSASSTVDFSEVRSLPLIFMTYASPLTGEMAGAASPGYVRQVLTEVAALRDLGLVDGSLIYNLRLETGTDPNGPTSYAIIQEYYSRWN